MKARIVLATDSLDPSGVGEHMLTLAGQLKGRFELVLACIPTDHGQVLLSRAADLGVAVWALDRTEGPDVSDRLGSTGAHILHVHAGVAWEGHGLTQAGRAAGCKVIRTEHLPFVLTDPAERQAYAQALASVDLVIAVSEASAQTYRANGVDARMLAVVQNGIDPRAPDELPQATRARIGVAPDDVMMLTVARFTAQKGHSVLLEAMPAVLRRHPNARLILVGEGPDEAGIHHLVERGGLGYGVAFLGQRDDVPDLLAAADVFVLPSRFEGLSLALLEAMAAGLPIVASRIGPNAEALGADHPYLVTPGQADELAKTVNMVLDDRISAQRAGQVSRERFQSRHRAAQMAGETERHYVRLLASPVGPGHVTWPARTVRIGFVGAGGIAHRHLRVLEQFEDVTVVGFADPEVARAVEVAGRYGGRAFADYRSMLEAEELDAVYICVPPFAHGRAEEDVIARGLPFFVEKPLSVDLGIAERIARASGDRGLVTAVGYHWRCLDIVAEARRLLAEDPALLIIGYWLDSTPPPQWWWKTGLSGGQVVEQATHILDLARYLVGDVTDVFGCESHLDRAQFPGLDVATASTASLKFASGAVGSLSSTCLLNWKHRVGLHLFSDGLAIELTDQDMVIGRGQGRTSRSAEGDPVWQEDRDFVDAVQGKGNSIACSYQDALESHRLALSVASSAASGRPVRVAAPTA